MRRATGSVADGSRAEIEAGGLGKYVETTFAGPARMSRRLGTMSRRACRVSGPEIWARIGKGIRMMHLRGSRRIGVMLGLLVVLSLAAGAQAGAFEVGQRWVYQHQGPRPGSTEPNAIDGQRIRQVIATDSQQGREQWVIEERFTADANTVGRLHVVAGRLLTAIEIENAQGEVVKMTYDTPVPYQMPEMEIAAEKVVETVLRMDSPKFALPVKVVIWRLEDESLTTPAGRFDDCRHYQMTTRSTINAKVTTIPLVEERQLWYHESVHGLVKEVYRKEPVKFLAWSQAGYTATSVLATFDTQAIVPAVASSEANDSNAPTSLPGRVPPPPLAAPVRGFPLWMPAVVIAVFAGAFLILIKRPRHK